MLGKQRTCAHLAVTYSNNSNPFSRSINPLSRRGVFHCCVGCSPTAPRTCPSGRPSRSFTASRFTSGERWAYRSVISMLSCPSSSFTATTDTPFITRWLAKLCRNPWAVRAAQGPPSCMPPGHVLDDAVGEPPSGLVAEDVRPLQVAVRLEGCQSLVGQGYGASPSALGWTLLPLPQGAADDERPVTRSTSCHLRASCSPTRRPVWG